MYRDPHASGDTAAGISASQFVFRKTVEHFVNCYEEFDAHRKSHFFDPSMPCYMLFGLPGVGKSTFVARLLSHMSNTGFMDVVNGGAQQDKKKFEYVEQVKIGHGVGATTLIPKTYHIGSVQVCDMPGFRDSDKEKRIIISILMKCFLSMTMASDMPCYYLVVVDIEWLNEDRAGTLIQDYFGELVALFGANFETVLASSYFLMTKNDKMKFTPDEVRRRLKSITMGAMALANVRLHRFLERVYANHIILNYANDDAGALLAEIDKRIRLSDSAGQETRALNMRLIADDRLNGQAELLVRVCEEEIARMVTSLERSAQNFERKLLPSIASRMTAMQSKVDRLADTHVAAAEQLKLDASTYARLEQELVQLDESLPVELDAVAQAEAQVHYRESQIKIMDSSSSKYETVNTHTFLSRKLPSLNVFSTYFVEIKVDLRASKTEVLVMRLNGSDAALQQLIGNSRLTPKSLEVFRTFDHDALLYSTAAPKPKRPKCEFDVRLTDTGLTSISCRASEIFALYIFTSVPLVKTPEFVAVRAQQERNRVEVCVALAGAKESLKRAEQRRSQAAKQKEESLRKLRDSWAKAEQSRQTVNLAKADFDALSAYVLHELDAAMAGQSQDAPHGSNSLQLVQKVVDIFRANGMATTLDHKVRAFEAQQQHYRQPLLQKMQFSDMIATCTRKLDSLIAVPLVSLPSAQGALS